MAKIAERLAYLEAVIGADITQFRKGMRDIRNETGILSEVTRGVSGAARTLTFAYTAPLVVLGVTALQTASEFEQAMRNINSIAGLSEEQFASLSEQTLEFGKTTRSGAIASAEALYTVFSAGIMDTEDAFALMNTSVKTAEAGLADLNTTTNALVSILLSYGDTSAEQSERASNALTRMVQVGVGSMDAFASAIGGVMPAASATGTSIEELFADMAFLTQRGLSAANASVSLNAILGKLINPTEELQTAFRELGGRDLPDLVQQFGSVNEVIEAIILNADGDLTSLHKMFNSKQAARGIDHFIIGMEQWQQAQTDFNAAMEGATDRAWEEQMKTFAASWDLLKSAVQGAGIAIGQTMFPVLQPIIDGLTDLVNTISSTSPELLSMVVGFTAFSAILPPLIWLLTSMLSPIGLLVAGIGALSTAFITNFGGIRDAVSGAVNTVLGDLEPLSTAISDLWAAVFPEDLEQTIAGDTQPIDLNPYDYITVTEPKSLWQIYEEMGYASKFSWQEFMDAAFAGGWQGGAITPDTPITIAGNQDPEIMRMENAINNQMAQPAIDSTPLVKSVQDALMAIIPAVSETAGLVGGKVASLVFDGVVSGINYVFSGQAITDAGNFFATAKTWLTDNVVTPFQEGISTALEGTALQTALDGISGFFTQIQDTFDLEGGIDLSGFTALVDGISSAFTSLQSADWSGVAKLGVIIGIIAGGTFGVAIDVLNGIGRGVGAIIETLGAGLASVINALALAGNGDIAGAVTALGGAVVDFGLAILQIPIGIIDTLVNSVLNLLGLENIDITGWFEGIREQIDAGLKEFIAGDPLDTGGFNMGDELSIADLTLDMSGAAASMNNEITDTLGIIKQDIITGTPVDFVVPADFTFTPEVIHDLELIGLMTTTEYNASAEADILAGQIRDEFIQEMQVRGIVIPSDVYTFENGTIKPGWEAYAEQAKITIENPEVIITGTPTVPEIPATGEQAVPFSFDWSGESMGLNLPTDGTPIPVDEVITVQPTQPVDMTGVSLAFSEDMLSGADAQSIIDANFLPLETKWNEMFSAEGVMAVTFAEFSTGVTGGWGTMSGAVNMFGLTVGVAMPIATAVIMGSTTLWRTYINLFTQQVYIARDAVNELISVIGHLMEMEGSFSITVEVSGDIDLGQPTKLAKGLNEVPYDGYLAELHKGERVLTAKQANDMDEGNYGAAVLTATPTQGGNENVTNNFYGLQNVDEIIFEMKRRGYSLGK